MNISNKNYLIELEHILIELNHNRGEHMRHFIDQWFCYKNGYITKSGKAKWSEITFNEYNSKGVLELLKQYNKEELKKMKSSDRLFVEKEHVVPLKIITQELLLKPRLETIEQIENVLKKNVLYATITKKEDAILNKMGLRQQMPKNYYDPEDKLYRNPFARYLTAGIILRKAADS